MMNSLSGRFLGLTMLFVMLAEVLIFVPSVARFREAYLLNRLEQAQIASLAQLADDMIDAELELELLETVGVYNIVLHRNETRQLVLSSPIEGQVGETIDLREADWIDLIRDALVQMVAGTDQIIRVIGYPTQEAGDLIEITMDAAPLRTALLEYGLRVLILSALISLITAALLFLAVRWIMVLPIRRVVAEMKHYSMAPEDSRRIVEPRSRIRESREAEETLQAMQTELTAALRQKARLAQLGGAVAKISHDLRNILSTAQLFADRMEGSDDPRVQRSAPKLVGAISRAVHLCESTLAFGKAEEPPPTLDRHPLAPLVDDVLENERLTVERGGPELINAVDPTMVVRCDGDQIKRAIGNLVRNAREAMETSDNGGVVTVSAEDTEEAWRVSVVDTGPGLPPKAREHLFAAFQGSSRKGGIGLGLVIAQELVKGHGGSLSLVRSDEDGTAFAFDLPKGEAVA